MEPTKQPKSNDNQIDDIVKMTLLRRKKDSTQEKSLCTERAKIDPKTPPKEVKNTPQTPYFEPFQISSKKPVRVPWPDANKVIRFFETFHPPPGCVQLNICTRITDLEKYVKGEIELIKAQNGNEAYRPYFDRLILLMQILN